MSKILPKRTFGVALDIGTTDIKGSLLDLLDEKEVAGASVPNEQKAFGQDVITRLYFAIEKKGMEELNKRVVSAVNKLIKILIEDAAVDVRDIEIIVAAGNSTMYHLMLMIEPTTLVRAPFLPVEKKLQKRNANKMGIRAGKNAIFKFLPNISGFVGSDILASILMTGMHKDKSYNLIMDMGTNGEIALGSRNRIFVTSCASGPAFEGRHIRCGMPSSEGAIIGAKIKNRRLFLKTVGNTAPKGISGSGLIDIASILLNKRIIERHGRMKRSEFIVHKKAGRKIYLIPEDIRELQLAKAALSSGAEILRRKAKIEFKNLKRFYITGAFGRGIDKKNARNIGLIPKEVPLDKIIFLENGALSGAKRFLLNPSCEKEINKILAKCRHIELHRDDDFEKVFAGSMYF